MVHPFNRNRRVLWDPSFNDPAQSGIQGGTDTIVSDDIPENPDLSDLSTTFQATDEKDYYVPYQHEDEYSGKSRLRYGNNEIPIDPEIPNVARMKKLPMDQVKYEGESHTPPEKVQDVDIGPTRNNEGKNKDPDSTTSRMRTEENKPLR